MPLSQSDPTLDYDGSWGDASNDWPRLIFAYNTQSQAAYVACHREVGVTYGSYVLVDRELRLETPDWLHRTVDHLILYHPNLQFTQVLKPMTLSLRETLAEWAKTNSVSNQSLIEMLLRQVVYLKIGTTGDTCNKIAEDLKERLGGWIS